MKKIILFMIMVFGTFGVWGQENAKIVISVVAPQQVDNLNASQTASLSKKMLNLAVKSGLASVGKLSGIIMYPVFTVVSEEIVEGGMQKLTVVSADISFVVKHLESEMVFDVYNVQMRGSDFNREQAINKAISGISAKETDFNKFVANVRRKIMDYYADNCSTIILTAQSEAKRQNFETAIALLASIPNATPCYPQALRELDKVYADYRKQQCNELLQLAQSMYAGHNYLEALSMLYDLKVYDTPCYNESKSLSAKIEAKLTADEQRAWDFAVQKDNNRYALISKGIDVIQSITSAFFNRKINEINYTIVK